MGDGSTCQLPGSAQSCEWKKRSCARISLSGLKFPPPGFVTKSCLIIVEKATFRDLWKEDSFRLYDEQNLAGKARNRMFKPDRFVPCSIKVISLHRVD